MNYSYYCKDCGFTSFSDDKKEIAKIGKIHRRPMLVYGEARRNRCGMVPTKCGTLARLDLVGRINELEVP